MKQHNGQSLISFFLLQISKKLKDIPIRIQSASLKERHKVVEEIQDVLSFSGEWRLYELSSLHYNVGVGVLAQRFVGVHVG